MAARRLEGEVTMSMEKMAVQGRLGSDAELRYLPTGKALLTFSVAIDQTGKDSDKPPVWRKVTVWGEKAQELADTGVLVKGVEAYAEGYPNLREWDGSDGQHHVELAVTAYLVQPIGAFRNRQRARTKPEPDDIPF
jgi:single-strand DNA-binding protein